MELIDPADLYSIGAAAALLQVDQIAVKELIESGHLLALKLPSSRSSNPITLVPAESLIAVIGDLDRQVSELIANMVGRKLFH